MNISLVPAAFDFGAGFRQMSSLRFPLGAAAVWNGSIGVMKRASNSSVSRNATKSQPADDLHGVIQIVFMLVLFVFMVVANSSVIMVTSMTRKSSRVKFFIMNLAIADLLVTLLSHLPDTIMRICIFWYADDLTCRGLKYIMGVVSYASRYVLVAMTIDRLHAIVKPMSFAEGGRLSKWLIGIAWFLAFLFAVPFLVLSRLQTIRGGQAKCIMSFRVIQPLFGVTSNNTQVAQVFALQAWKVYMTSIACLVFFIPTLIIACCYAVIISVVWRSQGKLKELAPGGSSSGLDAQKSQRTWSDLSLLRPFTSRLMQTFSIKHKVSHFNADNDGEGNGNDGADSGGGSGGAHKNMSSTKQTSHLDSDRDSNSAGRNLHVADANNVLRQSNKGVLPKAKIKSIYMTFVIVIAFILCWTPFFLFNLLDVYRAIPQNQTVAVIIQSLSHLHSAVNPIIFYIFNRDAWQAFRQIAVVNLFRCRCGYEKNGNFGLSDRSMRNSCNWSTGTVRAAKSHDVINSSSVSSTSTARKSILSSRSDRSLATNGIAMKNKLQRSRSAERERDPELHTLAVEHPSAMTSVMTINHSSIEICGSVYENLAPQKTVTISDRVQERNLEMVDQVVFLTEPRARTNDPCSYFKQNVSQLKCSQC